MNRKIYAPYLSTKSILRQRGSNGQLINNKHTFHQQFDLIQQHRHPNVNEYMLN